MKNNATKEKLMEMLVKLNPNSKILNEIAPTAQPIVGTAPLAPAAPAAPEERMAGDVASLQRAGKSATGMQAASSRINTATEFPQAFKLWFASLGYKPENQAISTAKVLVDVRKAMEEMGYK